MAKTKKEAIDEIDSYVTKKAGAYQDWYVGVSQDAKDRLFKGHGVKEKGDAWIWRRTESSAVAREVEQHFLALGMHGGSGGGETTADAVYAYKKAAHTNP